MTDDDARDRVSEARGRLRDAVRAVSVPTPDWGAASEALRWAATLCMELARDCRRESRRGDKT